MIRTLMLTLTFFMLIAAADGTTSPKPADPPHQPDAASDARWPPLPTTGFIAGRAATHKDVEAKNAVFVAEIDGRIIGTPLDIIVPQYAILVDKTNSLRKRVIVVQAEQAQDMKLIGYLEIGTGAFGVGTLPEFELLGRTPKHE